MTGRVMGTAGRWAVAAAVVMATVALAVPAGAGVGGQSAVDVASSGFGGLPPTLLLTDSGINPYHEDFHLPEGFVPPAGYYPEAAELLDLALDASSYAEAVERDRDIWDGLEPGKLYAFNGTKIVGAIQFDGAAPLILDPVDGPTALRGGGHGTLVASAAVGNRAGACPSCRIVMSVNPPAELRYAWALEHDWIDALSLSVSNVGGVGWIYTFEEHEARLWARSGRAWFTSAGNGGTNTVNHLDSKSGSPWSVRVGRGDPPQADWTRTYDVVGRAARRIATHDSLDEYFTASGTSVASPAVAGHFLMLLWEARDSLGDTEGLRDGVLARAEPGVALPAAGPLSDGELTAVELQEVLMATAGGTDPPEQGELPNHPPLPLPPELSYWWEGFGMVDEESMHDARAVLLGDAEMPEKPWPAWWRQVDQYARQAWGGTLAPCKTRYFDFVACLQESTWDPVGDLPGAPPDIS